MLLGSVIDCLLYLSFMYAVFSFIFHCIYFRIYCIALNKNIIMSSFKGSGDIQEKEGGPDSCFG